MAELTLEQRVAALEMQLAAMQSHPNDGEKQRPWLRTMGMFAGDAGMKEIFDEALKIREADRRRARRGQAGRAKKRRVAK